MLLHWIQTRYVIIRNIYSLYDPSYVAFCPYSNTRRPTEIYKCAHWFVNDLVLSYRKLQPNTVPEIIHHNIDPRIGAEAVSKMISCNQNELDLATLANNYYPSGLIHNRDQTSFIKCQERRFGMSISLHAENAIKYVENKMLFNITRAKAIIHSCLPFLVEKCKKSKIVVQKFIRMTMDMAKLLLHGNQNLKLIHLVRDPRAMLDSQVRKRDSGAHILSTFKGRAHYMCQQMLSDLQLAKELKRVYPDQIYTVRYEDMIDVNKTTIKNIFQFIDIPFSKNDDVYVKQTSRQSSSKNSTHLIVPWQKHISLQNLNIVNSFCSPLYKELGYNYKIWNAHEDQKTWTIVWCSN